jgi:hypothetical protein
MRIVVPDHGGRWICHSTIAHGAGAPQPSAWTSSPHHGQCRMRSVWAQPIVGVSTMHHSTQRFIVTDKTQPLLTPPNHLRAAHILIAFLAPTAETEKQDDNNRSIGRNYCIGTAADGPYVAAGIVACNLQPHRHCQHIAHIIVKIIVISIFFSSFNGIDLLHSISADCCMPRCRE